MSTNEPEDLEAKLKDIDWEKLKIPPPFGGVDIREVLTDLNKVPPKKPVDPNYPEVDFSSPSTPLKVEWLDLEVDINDLSEEDRTKLSLTPGMIMVAQDYQKNEDLRIRCLAFAAENRFRAGQYDEGIQLMNCAAFHFWRQDAPAGE